MADRLSEITETLRFIAANNVDLGIDVSASILAQTLARDLHVKACTAFPMDSSRMAFQIQAMKGCFGSSGKTS
jgi:hypothetical protein